jgi:hypothetical protein
MHKKVTYTLLVLMITALLLSACQSSGNYTTSYEPASPAAGYDGYSRSESTAYTEVEQSKASYASNGGPLPDPQRIVIRNADMALIVPDPSQSMDRAARMAEEMGGFVVFSQLYQRTIEAGVEVPEGSLTIRVPAERLTEAMDRIQSESSRPPVRRNVNSEDVTSTYVDLSSRLRNLQAAEEQLQEIMDEARRTEDVLQVYSELVRVREQIEVIQGQLNYYDQASALSSISVAFTADAAVQPISIAGWEPSGVAKTAIQSLVNSMQVLANMGIWLVLYALPMLLLLALPIVVLVTIVRKLRRREHSAPPPAPAV